MTLVATDQENHTTTAYGLPISARGGVLDGWGVYSGKESLLVYARASYGGPVTTWYEGQVSGVPRRPFARCGRGNMYVPPSSHGRAGRFPAAVLVGNWMGDEQVRPYPLLRRPYDRSAPTVELGTEYVVCSSCLVPYKFDGRHEHSCVSFGRAPGSVTAKEQQKLASLRRMVAQGRAVAQVVFLLGISGTKSWFAVLQQVKQTEQGDWVRSGSSSGFCIVFIDTAQCHLNRCSSKHCLGSVSHASPHCPHLAAGAAWSTSVGTAVVGGMNISGFLAFDLSVADAQPRACNQPFCRDRAAEESMPAFGWAHSFSCKQCRPPVHVTNDVVFDGADECDTGGVGDRVCGGVYGQLPTPEEILMCNSLRQVQVWCTDFADIETNQPIRALKAALILALHAEEAVSMLQSLCGKGGKKAPRQRAKAGHTLAGSSSHPMASFRAHALRRMSRRCVRGSLCELDATERDMGAAIREGLLARDEGSVVVRIPVVPLDVSHRDDILAALQLAKQRGVPSVVPLTEGHYAVLMNTNRGGNHASLLGYSICKLRLLRASTASASSPHVDATCTCSTFRLGRRNLGGGTKLSCSNLCSCLLTLVVAKLLAVKDDALLLQETSAILHAASVVAVGNQPNNQPVAAVVGTPVEGVPELPPAQGPSSATSTKSRASTSLSTVHADRMFKGLVRFPNPFPASLLRDLEDASDEFQVEFRRIGAPPQQGAHGFYSLPLRPLQRVCTEDTCIDPFTGTAQLLSPLITFEDRTGHKRVAWCFVAKTVFRGTMEHLYCSHAAHSGDDRRVAIGGVEWSLHTGFFNVHSQGNWFFSLPLVLEFVAEMKRDKDTTMEARGRSILAQSFEWMQRHRPDDPLPEALYANEALKLALFTYLSLQTTRFHSPDMACLFEGCGWTPFVLVLDACLKDAMTL